MSLEGPVQKKTCSSNLHQLFWENALYVFSILGVVLLQSHLPPSPSSKNYYHLYYVNNYFLSILMPILSLLEVKINFNLHLLYSNQAKTNKATALHPEIAVWG